MLFLQYLLDNKDKVFYLIKTNNLICIFKHLINKLMYVKL